jgi:hypothetical protein
MYSYYQIQTSSTRFSSRNKPNIFINYVNNHFDEKNLSSDDISINSCDFDANSNSSIRSSISSINCARPSEFKRITSSITLALQKITKQIKKKTIPDKICKERAEENSIKTDDFFTPNSPPCLEGCNDAHKKMCLWNRDPYFRCLTHNCQIYKNESRHCHKKTLDKRGFLEDCPFRTSCPKEMQAHLLQHKLYAKLSSKDVNLIMKRTDRERFLGRYFDV